MGDASQRVRAIVTAATQPALPPHIKLRHDAGRSKWLVLAPERVFEPDEVAVAVLKLCDGTRTVDVIASELAKEYDAPKEEIVADIVAMLQDLADKGVVKA